MSSRLLALVFPCRASSLRQGLRRSPLALAAPQSGSPQQKATSTGVVSPTQSAELATLQEQLMSKPLQQSELLSTLEPRVELHRRFEALANSAEYWQAADLQFPSNEALHQVQLQLAHIFRSPMLLKLACLHSSASSAGNNMLAWVGDAAMQLVISEQLCARYPTTSVGDLTRVRSYLVSRPTFAQTAEKCGLQHIIVVGKSLQRPLPLSLMAEMFESVMGAVYVDAGLDCVRAAYLHTQPLPKSFQDLEQTLPKAFGGWPPRR